MQTIITKYKDPTNTKGARILVRSWLKNKAVAWDHALNSEDNHKAAAQALVDVLNAERVENRTNWYQWQIVAEGSMPDGKGNAYIIDLVKAV